MFGFLPMYLRSNWNVVVFKGDPRNKSITVFHFSFVTTIYLIELRDFESDFFKTKYMGTCMSIIGL